LKSLSNPYTSNTFEFKNLYLIPHFDEGYQFHKLAVHLLVPVTVNNEHSVPRDLITPDDLVPCCYPLNSNTKIQSVSVMVDQRWATTKTVS